MSAFFEPLKKYDLLLIFQPIIPQVCNFDQIHLFMDMWSGKKESTISLLYDRTKINVSGLRKEQRLASFCHFQLSDYSGLVDRSWLTVKKRVGLKPPRPIFFFFAWRLSRKITMNVMLSFCIQCFAHRIQRPISEHRILQFTRILQRILKLYLTRN